MEKLSKRTFGIEMARLGVAFNRAVDRALLNVYYEAVLTLSDVQFKAGVSEAIRTERFFPAPATLLEMASPLQTHLLPAAPARTEEQRESDRLEARKGVELIRQEWLKRTGEEI